MINDFDVAIVGAGGASLLVAEKVREAGLAPIIIADHPYGALAPTSFRGRHFNLLPIYPVSGTPLASRLARAGSLDPNAMLKVIHRPSAEVSIRVETPERRTFFRKRLFGNLGQSFEGVERKESVHYEAAHAPGQRFGFVAGLSPYYKYIQQLPAFPSLSLTGARFGLRRRAITFNEVKVRYRALVWTQPLQRLRGVADMAALPSFTCIAADASFCLLTTQRGPPANILIYECSSSSPIYRVFTPDTGLAIAQLCDNNDQSTAVEVAGAVGALFSEFSSDSDWRAEHRIVTRAAYPVALEPTGLRPLLDEWCDSHDILLFGRFGRWEYKDLHDLDWNAIDRLIDHLL